MVWQLFINNSDRILRKIVKIFTVYELDDIYCPEYLRAYKEHEKSLLASLKEETVDVDIITAVGNVLAEYDENNDDYLVILVNFLSLKPLHFSSMFSHNLVTNLKTLHRKNS